MSTVLPIRRFERDESGSPAVTQVTEGLSAVDEADLAVREALADEYQLEGFLGQGGMSVVFLAREVALNRLVALKVLPRRFTVEGNAADRFRQEATIAASLDHPNIVPIHRIGESSRCLWYAMKYIRGRSLEQLLRDAGPLGLHDCFSVIEQVTGALHYAHRRGVVHRDMKPANVMLDDSGWAYVCDFGVAKQAGNPRLTQTGGTLGTPLYMSPEQLYGKPVDGRSDQYALAVLTYELLTGVHPFSADSVGEIIRKHCTEAAPDLSAFREDLPARVGEAVGRALSKDPDDRFGDVVELLIAMGGRRPRRALPTPGSEPDILTAATRPMGIVRGVLRSGRRRLVTVGALALALAGGVVAGRGSQPASAPPTLPPPTAEPAAAAVVPASGKLWVNSEPWGQLYIDGARVGHTPATELPIGPGPHTIRVMKDGYVPHEQTIIVPAGDELRLTGIRLRRVTP
jgi:serine/threonine-protein kinase